MDEISTGLDSSTTFQIVQSMANFTHLREVTPPTHFNAISYFIRLQGQYRLSTHPL